MSDVNQGGTPNDQSANANADPNATNANTQGSVDWSTVDVTQIPEDVIKNSALYKQVLAESIERRQKIKSLEDANKNTPEPPKDTANKPNDPLSQLAEQLNQFKGMMDDFNKERDLQRRKEAAKAAGLSEDLAPRLNGTNYDEYLADAKSLAPMFAKPNQDTKPNDNSSPGNPAGDKRDQGVLNAIIARNRGSSDANPFAPGFQAKQGGGIFQKD